MPILLHTADLQTLPPCITRPLLAVTAHVELPPVATYAALNLWNFCTVDSHGSRSNGVPFDDLDRLQALHTFTDTESESWFFVVSVAMECRAAKIVPVLLEALKAASAPNAEADAGATAATVTAALRDFVNCIHDVGRLLERMHERCDPDIFFFQIRPFLAGSKNMAAQGLPNGVFYDEGDGRGQWRQLRGGSNGQSSLIQLFDIVLGVEHEKGGPDDAGGTPPTQNNNGDRKSQPKDLPFHQEVRAYMPGPHRRFLEMVAAMPSLRAYVARQRAEHGKQADALVAAFKEATEALAVFRNKHLAIVARYIILPSRRAASSTASSAGSSPCPKFRGLAAPDQSHQSHPHGASLKEDASPLTGTGGTELLPFLKQMRNETLRAGLVEPER